MRAQQWAGLLFLCVFALAAACGDGASHTVSFADALSRGDYGVGVITIDLVDASRPTEPNRTFAGSDTRALTVEVWYPTKPSDEPEVRDAAVAEEDAPYPFVVFAHGFSGNRRQSASYTQHLASHGYVVAAPDFPLSNIGSPGGPRLVGVLEQPEDVSFVIDSLLTFNDESGHLLQGAIDRDAIGLSGHSLGGLTTMLAIYGPDRDERIDAALPISPAACFLPDGFDVDSPVPLLVITGTNDLITPFETARRAYDGAPPPRYLAAVMGADHVRFADIDIEDTEIVREGVLQDILGPEIVEDAVAIAEAAGGSAATCASTGADRELSDQALTGERQRELLRATGALFFDAYLKGDEDAALFLEAELQTSAPEILLAVQVD